MCGYQLAQELHSIPSNIAAFVLETPRRELCGCLTSFRKFRLEVAELDVNLQDTTSAVWVHVQEPLLEELKESIDLCFVIICLLAGLLLAEHGNQIAAHINYGTT